VAVAAVFLGAEATRRRWVHFRQRALENEVAEQFDRFLLGGGVATVQCENGRVEQISGPETIQVDEDGGFIECSPTTGYEADRLRRRADYHARLKNEVSGCRR
jgi:hypothetical protein